MPVLIRHLWQLKTVVFLQWCLKCRYAECRFAKCRGANTVAHYLHSKITEDVSFITLVPGGGLSLSASYACLMSLYDIHGETKDEIHPPYIFQAI